MNDTKGKILDTAERLFGEQGYTATSLRQVIAKAGVNLAAVHYHFGSKEDLLDAVIVRKVAPINEARLAFLDRVEEAAGSGRPEVEKILESFLVPTVETASRNPEFVQLMGRMLTEGIMPSLVEKHFQSTAMRFVASLRRALPELGQEELLWRVHFMIGAMAHSMVSLPVLPGLADAADMGLRMKRLVTFLAAGFRAPASADAIQLTGKEK